MGTDGRDYLNWSSNRGKSSERLDRIPGITTVSNGVRYYSSVDAEIFFGDLYIGELTSVNWQMQQNVLPIYGYNSYCFDDLGIGNRIVQGQFSINFTKANWLQSLQDDTGFSKIARRQYGADPVEESVYSDYRKRLNLPKWDKGFDIVVGYGHHNTQIGKVKNTSTSCYTVLDCCQITGCMAQLDYQGQPVQEVYTFIARDMKEAMATPEEKNPSNNNGTDGDVSSDKPGSINVMASLIMSKNEVMVFSPDNIEWVGAGECTFIDDFKDKKLNSKFNIYGKTDDNNDNIVDNAVNSYLRAELEQSFMNSLIKEIKEKNLKSLKATMKLSYHIKSEEKTRKITTTFTTNVTLKK